MIKFEESYDSLYKNFKFEMPENFNIGVATCDKWFYQAPNKTAIIHVGLDGEVKKYSYEYLFNNANLLANVLTEDGFQVGDRVAILLPQSPETAFSHIAIYKAGGIAVPLFSLFGEDAINYRVNDSGTRFLITNKENLAKVESLATSNNIKIYCIDASNSFSENLYESMSKVETVFEPVETQASTPALLIYTSGTTGNPKGALHGHGVLLGHLPGVEMSHNFFPQDGDLIWTPADWAWIGGLYDVLMPALYHGVPIVSCRFKKFIPEEVFQLISDLKIKNMFLPPTALKLLSTIDSPEQKWDFNVRTIASGGESLGEHLHTWGKKTFNTQINEFYGQTECNMVISSCSDIMDTPPGFIGKAVPGHLVEIINDKGEVLPNDEIGDIAIHINSPSRFLKYWNNSKATQEKHIGNWLITGDQGLKNKEGFIKFIARSDDVITSAGYRIGPGEIEDCLISHEAVQIAAVVGKPDELRTEIVKAFIVLNAGFNACDSLKEDIMLFVKNKLSAHEYPREIEFIESIPMTTTGKIIRKGLIDRAKTS